MYVKTIDLEKSKALAKNYIYQIAVAEREFHERYWTKVGSVLIKTKNKHDDKNEWNHDILSVTLLT